jgi:outer membrane lipoprotein carrier protein
MSKILVSILMAMSFISSAYSQNMSEAQIRTKINQAASQLQTLQCDFVQTKHLKMLNDKLVSHGKMYYKKSDKLRWEYTTPYHYIFILNGSRVLLKNEKRNDIIDVNQNKVFKEIARLMMNSVVGKSLSDSRDFSSKISSSNSELIATLTPMRKDLKQMFKQISLYFSQSTSLVYKVILVEKNGDKTVIELKNAKKNEPVNTNVFKVN